MRHNTIVLLLIIGLITGIVLFEFSFSFAYEAINQESVSTWSLRAIFDHTNPASELKSDYTHRWAQHPFLTRSAIKLFEDYKGRDVFTEEEEKLIIRGAIEEDTDVPPSLSMNEDDIPSFFNKDYYLITTSASPLSFGLLVKKFFPSDHKRCANHFDPAINVLGIPMRRTTEFAQFFNDGSYTANHFAWENISKVDEDLQLIMLGHVLHLLEDMGCPPHTRRDMHGGRFGGGESDYEKILGEHFFGIKYTTASSARIKADSQIEDKDTLTEYLEALRDLTQKGYFSRNTMFSDDYEQNFIPVNDKNSNYIYKNSIGGTKLAYKGPDFWIVYNFFYRAYFLMEEEERKTAAFNKAKTWALINYSVAEDYFDELEMPIIKHCAGVINLFYKTFINPPDIDNDGDGYTENNGDCDDSNSAIHPGVPELCNGVDDDCDASTPDGSGETPPSNPLQDGVCAGSVRSCTGGMWIEDYSGLNSYEENETSCDGLDNDCDGQTDEECGDVQYSISGKVVYEGTDTGIPNVQIELTSMDICGFLCWGTCQVIPCFETSTNTDQEGNYIFTGIPEGDYFLTPTYPGNPCFSFTPSSLDIAVTEDLTENNFEGACQHVLGTFISTNTGNGADSFIYGYEAYSNYGSQEEIVIKNDIASYTRHRKGYIRFDISSINSPISDAVLELTYSGQNGTSTIPSTYSVYGLLDAHIGENWDESTINWHNAPGNDTGSGSGVLSGETTFLGNFSMNVSQLSAGSLVTFSSPALLEFLQNDSNGLLTFIITRQQKNTANEMFASKEHPTLLAPRLKIGF